VAHRARTQKKYLLRSVILDKNVHNVTYFDVQVKRYFLHIFKKCPAEMNRARPISASPERILLKD